MSKYLLAALLLLSLNAQATVLDEGQCVNFGITLANATVQMENGVSQKDLIKKIDPKLPKDVQELVKAGLDVVFTFKGQLDANDHLEGASLFCKNAGGDVKLMTDVMKKVVEATKTGV